MGLALCTRESCRTKTSTLRRRINEDRSAILALTVWVCHVPGARNGIVVTDNEDRHHCRDDSDDDEEKQENKPRSKTEATTSTMTRWIPITTFSFVREILKDQRAGWTAIVPIEFREQEAAKTSAPSTRWRRSIHRTL